MQLLKKVQCRNRSKEPSFFGELFRQASPLSNLALAEVLIGGGISFNSKSVRKQAQTPAYSTSDSEDAQGQKDQYR